MSVIIDRIYLHIIFCVRQASDPLQPEWIRPVEHYLISTLQLQKQPLLGMAVLPDHVHLLLHYRPGKSLGGIIRQLKHSSSKQLKEAFPQWAGKFSWQKGYAAFSISSQRIDTVRSYLEKQERYHQSHSIDVELSGMISGPKSQKMG